MSTHFIFGAAEDISARIAQPGEKIGDDVVGSNLGPGSPVFALIVDMGDDAAVIEGTAGQLFNLAQYIVRVANTLPSG